MSLRVFLFTILSVPAVWSGGSVFATCLVGNQSLEQEFQNAAMVLVGRVTSEELTPESKNYLDGTTYTIHIEEVLRGSRLKEVRLFSANTSGRFPMQVGVSYLILAYKELERLQVDNCGNSGKISDKTTEVLAQLRKMKTGSK